MRNFAIHCSGTFLGLLCLSLVIGCIQANSQQQMAQQHSAWVSHSLERMKAIKVGMTRADLLKVFKTEGGLYTGLNRTYVFHECPYFKVDVEFEPVGRPARDAEGRVTSVESDADIIRKISEPYIAWSRMD